MSVWTLDDVGEVPRIRALGAIPWFDEVQSFQYNLPRVHASPAREW